MKHIILLLALIGLVLSDGPFTGLVDYVRELENSGKKAEESVVAAVSNLVDRAKSPTKDADLLDRIEPVAKDLWTEIKDYVFGEPVPSPKADPDKLKERPQSVIDPPSPIPKTIVRQRMLDASGETEEDEEISS